MQKPTREQDDGTPLKFAAAACAPYAVWMGLMFLLPRTAASYAMRSAATLAALVPAAFILGGRALRERTDGPGRRKPAFPGGALPAGIAAGFAVLLLWVLPEYLPFYREWCVIGHCPVPGTPVDSPYDPAVCGRPLALAKLAGSAFVIAPAEELFFRSFLYRFLQSRNWMDDALRRFDWQAFAWSAGLFALEHDRPVAALAAAAIYTAVYVRHGLAAACIAHSATNLALAAFVLHTGSFGFW